MWKLYDDLINEIPDDLIVDDYAAGGHFACLRSGQLCGLSFDTRGKGRPSLLPQGPVGQPLKRVAELAKSWNMEDATMGMAAINAFHNDRTRLETLGINIDLSPGISLKERKEKNPLGPSGDSLQGKKIGMIGHFRNVERKFGDYPDLYILERNPSDGDYPDSACEFLLPEMDQIFATGVTLINKTAKRLFELKREDAVFTMMGPTVTLSPHLFEYGVTNLAGFVITDPDLVWDVVSQNKGGMFAAGMMVNLTGEEFNL